MRTGCGVARPAGKAESGPRARGVTYTHPPMAATSLILLATAITIAIGFIVAIALVGRAHLRSFVRAAPLEAIRNSLALEVLTGAALLVAALGVGRQLGADLRSITPSNTLWDLAGLPASVGAVCVGMRAACTPGGGDGGVPSGVRSSFWLVSALMAGGITILLILSARMVLTDALLILVAAPAWMWMLGEWRTAGAGVLAHGADGRARSPGPLILLLCLPLSATILVIELRAPFPVIADLLTAGALLALLLPLALASGAGDLDAERAEWTAAPIYLTATIVPLVALAAATVTRVMRIVNHGAIQGVGAGTRWQVGAAESIASMPYLSGLPRLITPVLLALALPLLSIALAGVSPVVRRLAGVALIVSGIALGASALAST